MLTDETELFIQEYLPIGMDGKGKEVFRWCDKQQIFEIPIDYKGPTEYWRIIRRRTIVEEMVI